MGDFADDGEFQELMNGRNSLQLTEREVNNLKIRFKYQYKYRSTLKAYRIKINNRIYWLPKSQVEIHLEQKTVYIPNWLCKEKGIQNV